jgi:hypothetical protein
MATVRVVPALCEFEDGQAGMTWLLKRVRSSSSHSSVAKKLSQSALSYASPTEPVDGRTLISRHRRPKAIDVYWQPWSE